MTPILCLPNETLLAIANRVSDFVDLAALSLANRRLSSIATLTLYAAAASDPRSTRLAFFHAVENGYIELVRLLLKHGANPNLIYVSSVPRDGLHQVLAAQGRRPGRQPLIDRTLALEYIQETLRNTDPEAELAVSYRRLASTLSAQGDRRLSSADEGAYTFLIHQLHRGVIYCSFVWSSEAGSYISLSDPEPGRALDSFYHWTALHVAAHRGDDALVKLLLDNGAATDPLLLVEEKPASLRISESVDTRSVVPPVPQTPLYLAISAGHTSTVQLLLTSGASNTVYYPKTDSDTGVTALHVAAWHGSLGLCKSLLDRDPGLMDVRTEAQLTPFHYAVAGGHLQTVGRFLLDKGADIHACFSGFTLAGNVLPEWNCSAFTHALRMRRYNDAWMLMDIDPDVIRPCGNDLRPIQACFYGQDNDQSDEEHMLPILERLVFSLGPCVPEPQYVTALAHYLTLASEHHLPRTLELLLKSAEYYTISLPSFDSLLSKAFEKPRSNAAIETIKTLVDYGVSVRRMLTPGVGRVFVPGLIRPDSGYIPVPEHVNLKLKEDGAVEARISIAKLIYERLAASPQGVDPQDLRTALMGACQPGGLRACEWLASVGALSRVEKKDLSVMMFWTALPASLGGNDPDLARWVLAQAESMGLKYFLLSDLDVPHMITRSGGLEVAQVVVNHGADPDVPPPDSLRQGVRDGRVVLSCRGRNRLRIRRFHPSLTDHALFLACARRSTVGAVELVRTIIEAAGEGANELVNCVLLLGYSDPVYTPVSVVCNSSRRINMTPAVSAESARLAMLRLLLDAGAEVHTLVQRVNREDTEPASQENQNETGPDEPLWRALASEDEHEIRQLQEAFTGMGQQPRWRVIDWDKPIPCAIRDQMPSLVQAMLEARPLPVKNSPLALQYLKAACEGYYRLSPRSLKIILGMANIDDVDLPVNAEGETGLAVLMGFFKEPDFEEDSPEFVHPECHCESDLIRFEKDDLCTMASLLLGRGAKWNTRSPVTGRSALDELRVVLRDGMRHKGIYKCHNLAEFGKHIVLDVFAEGVDGVPDFNPFEMGDVRARGVSG